MTILEQIIDPDQIQIVPNTIAAICIYMTIGIVVSFIACKFLMKTNNENKEGKISDKSYLLRTFLSVFVVGFVIWFSIYPINTYGYKIPGLDHFTEPQGSPYTASFGNKQLFADAYRDEINDAVADKLRDYDIPECSIDKDYKSLLCPDGHEVRNIAATRDGKTYTLTPHLNYDKDTSTATLDVDIEEGYHG